MIVHSAEKMKETSLGDMPTLNIIECYVKGPDLNGLPSNLLIMCWIRKDGPCLLCWLGYFSRIIDHDYRNHIRGENQSFRACQEGPKGAQKGETIIINSGRDKIPVAKIEAVHPVGKKRLGALLTPGFVLSDSFFGLSRKKSFVAGMEKASEGFARDT